MAKDIVPNNLDEVMYMTAKESGVSIKQAEFIVSQFWKGVRFYISNPLLCTKGILIHGLGRFEIKKGTIKKIVASIDESHKKYDTYTKILKEIE